jgi:hypothetical protein
MSVEVRPDGCPKPAWSIGGVLRRPNGSIDIAAYGPLRTASGRRPWRLQCCSPFNSSVRCGRPFARGLLSLKNQSPEKTALVSGGEQTAPGGFPGLVHPSTLTSIERVETRAARARPVVGTAPKNGWRWKSRACVQYVERSTASREAGFLRDPFLSALRIHEGSRRTTA